MMMLPTPTPGPVPGGAPPFGPVMVPMLPLPTTTPITTPAALPPSGSSPVTTPAYSVVTAAPPTGTAVTHTPGTLPYCSSNIPPPGAIASVPTFTVAGSHPVLIASTASSSLQNMSLSLPQGIPGVSCTPTCHVPSLAAGTSMLAMAPSGVAIPRKLAQKIWKGEFVEMTDLLPEKLGQLDSADSGPSGSRGREQRKTKGKQVANILQ